MTVSSAVKRQVFLITWIVALGAAACIPALAIVRGTVWFGPGSFHSSGPLRHPLLSIGADVRLPRGSDSMVVAIFGRVIVSGTLRDDVAGIVAPIYLERGATVDRDLVALGDSVYRAPSVRIAGRVGGEMVPWSGAGAGSGPNWLLATWHYSGLSLAAGLALLLICTCIAVALPWQTVLVATHLHREIPRSIVAGLMGTFLFLFLVVPLGLSLFGLPFALLLVVVAAAAWMLGLTSTAVMLGRYLARFRAHEAGLLWVVVSGMFALALAGAVPWIGSLIVGLAGTTGAGSLALTMIARARPGRYYEIPRSTEHETLDEPGAYIERAGARLGREARNGLE